MAFVDYPVSNNFNASEFLCKCNDDCNGKDDSLINPLLLHILQDVRDEFNKPIIITSGLRCRKHNIKVGGSSHSKHTPEKGGYAADFKVVGMDQDVVAEYLLKKYPDKYGIGRYNGRTHIDVRPSKARWDYR